MTRVRSVEELEKAAGIKRTVRPAPTRKDVEILTYQRLRGPFWKRLRKPK